DQRAALVVGKLARLRPLYLDDDVGVLQCIGADDSTRGGEFRIGQARFDAGARLDGDIDAQHLEFFTVSGEAATRGSDGSISLATAIFIRPPAARGARARTNLSQGRMDTGFATG